MAHERYGDDRDGAEGIDHVSHSRAVRRRCHIARADLWKPNGVRHEGLSAQAAEKHAHGAARS
jgi:hypothetical protein